MHLQIQQQPSWEQLRAEGRKDHLSPSRSSQLPIKAVSSSFPCSDIQEEQTHRPLSTILLLCRFFTFSFVTAHWAHIKVHLGVFKFSFELHLWEPCCRVDRSSALSTVYSECGLQSGIETAFPLWRLYAVGRLLELQQHGHLWSRRRHRRRVSKEKIATHVCG